MNKNFKIIDIQYQDFIQVPRSLILSDEFKNISLEAKIVYCFLVDRLKISIKNEWVDKNGDVYIIFSIQEISESFKLAQKTSVKVLNELEENDFLSKKRQGFGKPNLIYLKKINFEKYSKNKSTNVIITS